jgi:hypothetical protein
MLIFAYPIIDLIIFWTLPLLNFFQNGCKVTDVQLKLHVRLQEKHGFHFSDFHESYNFLAALHGQNVYLNRHIDNEIWKLRVEIHFAST